MQFSLINSYVIYIYIFIHCIYSFINVWYVYMCSGRFGANTGLADSYCDGPCRPGYYCPSGSTNETAKKCGGSGVFCPLGSPAPVAVGLGHYSIGGDTEDDINTRYAQSICERGFYCQKSQYPQLNSNTPAAITNDNSNNNDNA